MTETNWLVIQNTKTKLYTAIEAIDGWACLTTNEEAIRTDLTKEKALMYAIKLNEAYELTK